MEFKSIHDAYVNKSFYFIGIKKNMHNSMYNTMPTHVIHLLVISIEKLCIAPHTPLTMK